MEVMMMMMRALKPYPQKYGMNLPSQAYAGFYAQVGLKFLRIGF